jgi:hypothetical protein
MKNGTIWPDNNGIHINAHAGGIIWHDDCYYWYGEHKGAGWNGRLAFDGVHCYSSKDLKSWEDEGLALKVVDDPKSPIVKGCRIERPKVLFCAKIDKFVMWWHSTDANHFIAKSGVATSDKPIGPFKIVHAFRPDAGTWPLNVTDEDKNPESILLAQKQGEHFNNGENDEVKNNNILGRDFEHGQMARDQGLFLDDDGCAYHIFASEHNSTLHLAKLTDDFLNHSGEYIRLFPNRWHEAPALFKRNDKYYLLSSGCTSWDANPARSAVADTIFGPWQELDNPCKGINPENDHGPETTFNCQSTFVLKIENEDRYIAMFDDWDIKSFDDSRYVWLPIEFNEKGYTIQWHSHWENN